MGNEAYQAKEYKKAANAYAAALKMDPKNDKAWYNKGNALFKAGYFEEAKDAWDKAIAHTADNRTKAEAYFNKGVALHQERKLEACIEAYKQSLRLNPADADVRQNLQLALEDFKKQQKKQEENKPSPKQKPQQQPPSPQKQKQQESPKLTPKEAADKLKPLSQKERNLQNKLRKNGEAASGQPEKDW
jgi:tetratricopeptide (TPR) repeat protein